MCSPIYIVESAIVGAVVGFIAGKIDAIRRLDRLLKPPTPEQFEIIRKLRKLL
jgi:hypothetical protein